MTRLRHPAPATAPAVPRAERPDDALTVRDVGAYLGVSVQRVHQLIRAGVLRASRLTPGSRYIILREWLGEAIRTREVRAEELARAKAAAEAKRRAP